MFNCYKGSNIPIFTNVLLLSTTKLWVLFLVP